MVNARNSNLLGKINVLVVLLLISANAAVGKTIHVKVGGTGDGSSWLNAHGSLQAALDDAEPNDSIWVAEGTYKPTNGTDRTIYFEMREGVGIYGGFAGMETSRETRDWAVNETILSGDIGIQGDNSDNTYHVVLGADNAILDGFTVTKGNANGAVMLRGRGGGMANMETSPTIRNCRFAHNVAQEHAAGIHNHHASSPTIIDCMFVENAVDVHGSAIFNAYSNAKIINCTFINNTAGWGGGGMSNAYSDPDIVSCTFSGNSAYEGGGIVIYSSSPTIEKCVFAENTVTSNGGGIYCLQDSSPTVNNCIFVGNSADANGGGIFCFLDSSPTVNNCTFVGNSAEVSGGGIYAFDSTLVVVSSILWDNKSLIGNAEIFHDSATVVVLHCDVQGGWTGLGSNNIDTDPLFIGPNGPDNIPGTEDDNLHLLPYSPCIDTGDPTGDYNDQTDIDGQQRVLYDNVDIGADEVFPIAGDIDMDGDVDFKDYAYFAGHWLKGK